MAVQLGLPGLEKSLAEAGITIIEDAPGEGEIIVEPWVNMRVLRRLEDYMRMIGYGVAERNHPLFPWTFLGDGRWSQSWWTWEEYEEE